MAKINFTKGEKFYTAEFQINGPTAIHIERNKVGPLYLKQKSVENGQYDFVKDFGYNRGGDLTIDTAIQGVVYPMWIKIESASEPTLAEMVEGEQSGGGAGNESTMEYLDISGLSEQNKTGIINFAGMLLKTDIDGTIAIAPGGIAVVYQSSAILSGALAIGYIPTVEIDMGAQGKGKIQYFIEQLENMGITLPRITKEQFYNLEA